MRRSLVSVALAASAALVLASCAMPADDPNFNASGGAFGSEAAAELELQRQRSRALRHALAEYQIATVVLDPHKPLAEAFAS